MLKRLILIFLLSYPCLLFSETPYIPINANFELPASDTQWSVVTKLGNSPKIRCRFYQGTNSWIGTNWNSAVFKYSKTDSSTNMSSVTGTLYTTTGTLVTAYTTYSVTSSTYSTYADFQILTNTFTYAFDNWYSTVLLTTTDKNVSQASGFLTIKRAPELE